jgi:5,10-methylenetetrahydrofolate reductase
MSRLAGHIAAGRFVVTAELEPPRGTDIGRVLRHARLLAGSVEAVNITDSPRANMRMSPIAVAHMIGEGVGLETVFHLTCRDRNVIGLQSELLGAAALGVQNILALTGDPPEGERAAHCRGVYEVDSLGLVRIAAALNQGRDVTGRALNAPTGFHIGVAANPLARDAEREVDRVLEKLARGAHFVQTQPVFDLETLGRFVDRVRPAGAPVIAGVLLAQSYSLIVNTLSRVPGISVPNWYVQALAAGGPAAGLSLLRELVDQLPAVAAGAHIMSMGRVEPALDLLALLGRRPAGR